MEEEIKEYDRLLIKDFKKEKIKKKSISTRITDEDYIFLKENGINISMLFREGINALRIQNNRNKEENNL